MLWSKSRLPLHQQCVKLCFAVSLAWSKFYFTGTFLEVGLTWRGVVERTQGLQV